MRPDKPQFWTGEGAGVNLAMTEITRPSRWEPIKNLTERTLVDVNIDCRGMLQGKLNIIQDEIVINTINNPIQKNIIVTPSQSLSFETIGIGTYDISSAIFSKLVFTSSFFYSPTAIALGFQSLKSSLFQVCAQNAKKCHRGIPTGIPMA